MNKRMLLLTAAALSFGLFVSGCAKSKTVTDSGNVPENSSVSETAEETVVYTITATKQVDASELIDRGHQSVKTGSFLDISEIDGKKKATFADIDGNTFSAILSSSTVLTDPLVTGVSYDIIYSGFETYETATLPEVYQIILSGEDTPESSGIEETVDVTENGEAEESIEKTEPVTDTVSETEPEETPVEEMTEVPAESEAPVSETETETES